MSERQQLLYLWLAEGALDMPVVAWAFHDGSAGASPGIPGRQPPYATGVAALEAGWFLIQSPAPPAVQQGEQQTLSYLPHEFLFERRVEVG